MTDVHLTQAEINRYWNFVTSEVKKFLHPPPPSGVLWHYTSGDGLVGIIETGKLWTTQVSCVNDSTELRYGISLVRDALTLRCVASATTDERVFYNILSNNLEIGAAPTNEWFIGSLSEDGDDLSQWRAYGGGEGGYSQETTICFGTTI
jgi:hypothetical protein